MLEKESYCHPNQVDVHIHTDEWFCRCWAGISGTHEDEQYWDYQGFYSIVTWIIEEDNEKHIQRPVFRVRGLPYLPWEITLEDVVGDFCPLLKIEPMLLDSSYCRSIFDWIGIKLVANT